MSLFAFVRCLHPLVLRRRLDNGRLYYILVITIFSVCYCNIVFTSSCSYNYFFAVLIVISNKSQWYFRLQNLSVHLLPLVFCYRFSVLLPNLSYRFKELLIMDGYLLSMIFHKLFHPICLEIWLCKANDIIIILLK